VAAKASHLAPKGEASELVICFPRTGFVVARAFSSEMETGSREENASKQQI
jgi:hypothetical protein